MKRKKQPKSQLVEDTGALHCTNATCKDQSTELLASVMRMQLTISELRAHLADGMKRFSHV